MPRHKKQRRRKRQKPKAEPLSKGQEAAIEMVIDGLFGFAERAYTAFSKQKAPPAPPVEQKEDEPPERRVTDLPAWARY